MDIQTRHAPSFPVVRVLLSPSESLRLESGAMMAMSADLALDAKDRRRIDEGPETQRARWRVAVHHDRDGKPAGGDGSTSLSPPETSLSSNITPDTPMLIQKGSFLCAEQGVEIDTKFGGLKSMVGGEEEHLLLRAKRERQGRALRLRRC